MLRAGLVLMIFVVGAAPAMALDPGEALKDQKLEARAREISRQLRCLVCQNQSIDDSDAPLAKDLRRLVRARLVKGDSDPQVIAFVRARYGDYVMLRPPIRPATWLLWFGPALLLLIAVAAIVVRTRFRPAATEAPPLSEEEQARFETLFGDDKPGREGGA
jgi:cytochrome c-type biogenesis protein CcmH